MGMSRDDFERCTPSEFSRIYECFAERENRLLREGWEQTRTLVSFLLPIYNTKKTAKQLLPFSWDEDTKKAAPRGSSSPEAFKDILNKVKGG